MAIFRELRCFIEYLRTLFQEDTIQEWETAERCCVSPLGDVALPTPVRCQHSFATKHRITPFGQFQFLRKSTKLIKASLAELH